MHLPPVLLRFDHAPWLGAALCAALVGCADDLEPADADIVTGGEGKIVTTREADGSYLTTIDATASDAWTAIDFDRGVESTEEDPAWDLAARRFHLKLPVPTTSEGVAVMALGDIGLAEASASASGTWQSDAEGDPALERGDGWYSYDPTTHLVSPRPITYLLRTGDGSLRALRIESYYDSFGTAAKLQVRWRPLRAAQAQGGSR